MGGDDSGIFKGTVPSFVQKKNVKNMVNVTGLDSSG
jgi:hypothetical protein